VTRGVTVENDGRAGSAWPFRRGGRGALIGQIHLEGMKERRTEGGKRTCRADRTINLEREEEH